MCENVGNSATAVIEMDNTAIESTLSATKGPILVSGSEYWTATSGGHSSMS